MNKPIFNLSGIYVPFSEKTEKNKKLNRYFFIGKTRHEGHDSNAYKSSKKVRYIYTDQTILSVEISNHLKFQTDLLTLTKKLYPI